MPDFSPSLLAEGAAERERFVAALRSTGSVTAAVRAVGCSKSSAYRLRRRDRAFAAAWDAALGDVVITALETALIDRATHGVERRRTYPDGTVETWREFDHKLGMFLLGKLFPDKFGANAGMVLARPRRVMTRKEFIAAIRARPLLEPLRQPLLEPPRDAAGA